MGTFTWPLRVSDMDGQHSIGEYEPLTDAEKRSCERAAEALY